MKFSLLIFAVTIALLTGCNRQSNQPERGTRLAYIARSARLNGKSTAEFPCPVLQQMTVGDLATATKYATVALVQPVASVVSPNGGDDIRTWYKFKIADMLHDRRNAGLPLSGIPAELLPIAPNEFVSVFCGGSVKINGVQITESGGVLPEFHEGHSYLLWFGLSRNGSGQIAWQNEGVFFVEGDAIRPITADSANTPLDRDLIQQVGTSMAKIRQYLAAHL